MLNFKKLMLVIIMPLQFYAQVGIGTTDPQAMLDIREPDPANPTASAGLAVPQVNVLPTSGNRLGQLVMLTTTGTFYYFNGSTWTTLMAYKTGDVKFGFETSDHDGWIKLDGRNVVSLTLSQRSNAATLGFTTTLPNALNSVLLQNGSSLGNVSGSMSRTLAQNQLPNTTLTGTTSINGNHSHTIAFNNDDFNGCCAGTNSLEDDGGGPTNIKTTASSGDHSHTFVTSSINGGVIQQALDITPRSLSVNVFVFLGL